MRLLARITGISLLIDGIPNCVSPKPWVNFWADVYNKYFAEYFPKSFVDVMEEYRNLSVTFFRLYGSAEIFYAVIMLSLADKEKR